MHIRASVVKNPGFSVTNTQKNSREHENLRTHLLRICVSAYRRNKITALGCDFFSSQTDTQIHKRTLENTFFWMVSFVYLWIKSGFCCHADRRCADARFRAKKKQIISISIVLIYLLYLTKDFAKRTSPWWSRSPERWTGQGRCRRILFNYVKRLRKKLICTLIYFI